MPPYAPLATRPGEYTRVGLETEVKIPALTYVFKSLVFMVVNTGLWGIAWLLVGRIAKRPGIFWRWFTRHGWRWYSIALILCWIGPSAAAYLYRLFVEQLAKNTPSYDNLDPREGPWLIGRFVRRLLGLDDYDYDEDDEPPMELEAVDVNVTTTGEGGKPETKTIPRMPLSRDAKQFYRAVAKGGAHFTESDANERFDIPKSVFREYIRGDVGAGGLIGRGLAEWKNKSRTQGVTVLDAGMRFLDQLGRRA
jgi:hypothetical protein